MATTLGQTPAVLPVTRDITAAVAAPSLKEIPYDYVARFQLRGERGNRVQEVVNITIEGAFVATAIGYSFIPTPPDPAKPARGVGTSFRNLLGSFAPVIGNDDMMRCLVRHFCGIDFRYSIIDSGTGRELQNLAIHNIAGLGESGGNRPFRPLARPALFMPRSTIRIEVEEISEGPLYGYDDASGRRVGAELYMVLHGYKILGYPTGTS